MMWDKRYIIAAVVLLFLVGGGVVALTDRHVTVTHEGGGTVSPEGDFTMKFYKDMELDVEPAEGWHVGAILVEGEPIEYDGSHTISIHFLDLTHTHVHVVFVEDGEPVPDKTLRVTSEGMGSVSPGGVTEHLDGERVTVTATPVEGYSVVSFVVDGIDKGPITSYDVIMDRSHEVHVVFNHYLEPHYTLMVFREGSGTTDPVDITHHDYGVTVDVRFIPDAGWRVGSVTVDGRSVGSPDSYPLTMDESHIVDVEFVPVDMVQLEVVVEGSGTVDPDGLSDRVKGETVDFTTTPDDGWYLKEVKVDGVSIGAEASFSVPMDSDRTVTVVFARIMHVLTVESEGDGRVGPAGETSYPEGTPVTVTAVPAEGWRISDVLVDGESIGARGTFEVPMDAPHSVLVIFEPRTYTLTFMADGEVHVTITQDYGTAVTAPADPTKTGHAFAGWDSEVPATMPAWDMVLEAQWTVNKYTLTYMVDGQTYRTVTDYYGAEVTAPEDPVKEGHTFAGWDPSVPATVPAQNSTFEASWTANTYTVTYDADGGTVTPATQDVVYGSAYTLAVPTADHRYFAGWYHGDTPVASDGTWSIASDVTLVAYWDDEPVYEASFAPAGASGTVSPIFAYEDDTIVLPANGFTIIGHTFAGWSLGDATYQPGDGYVMPAQDVEFTALWTVNKYTLTFKVDGQTYRTITQDYGTEVTAPADPTKTGHTFAGWDHEVPTTMSSEDTTFTALWTVNKYTLTFIVDNQTYRTITRDYGSRVAAPADPTKTGHTFAGWDHEVPATMPAENLTLTAGWKVNKYTLTFMADGEVHEIITQAYGTPVNAPEGPSKTGHAFSGWDVTVPATMPAQDMTFEAVFKELFQLTVTKNEGGTVEPASGEHVDGTPVDFEATPSDGYLFVSATVDGTPVGVTMEGGKALFSVVMDGDHSVHVTFAPVPPVMYDLDVTVGTGGSINELQDSYGSGTEVTIVATPRDGYRFLSATVDGTPVDVTMDRRVAVFTVEMTGDRTVEVQFQKTYILTVTSGPDGSTDPSGSWEYDSDYTAEVTITPLSGYRIERILVDGEQVDIANPLPVTMSKDRTVHVTFEEIPMELTVEHDGSDAIGSVSVGGTPVDSGSVTHHRKDSPVTIEVTPADRHAIGSITVDGEDIEGMPRHASYEFTLPMSSDHRVEVAFVELLEITLDATGTDIVYDIGDYLDTSGLIVTAHYDDGSSRTVNDYTATPERFKEVGAQDVTVTYRGETATYEVSVQPVGGVDVFVIEHNGEPVATGTHLRDFTFDTALMAPGDVRTMTLRLVAEGMADPDLDAFIKLSGLDEVNGLAEHVEVDVSVGGVSVGSATLEEMWQATSIGLGVLPAGGLDVVLSVRLLEDTDSSHMGESVSFRLEAGAGVSP